MQNLWVNAAKISWLHVGTPVLCLLHLSFYLLVSCFKLSINLLINIHKAFTWYLTVIWQVCCTSLAGIINMVGFIWHITCILSICVISLAFIYVTILIGPSSQCTSTKSNNFVCIKNAKVEKPWQAIVLSQLKARFRAKRSQRHWTK